MANGGPISLNFGTGPHFGPPLCQLTSNMTIWALKMTKKLSNMTPGFSKFDHKCVKVPNQDKQKYRTKTSSQDTPDFKKMAVRMVRLTHPELLSHLLFLSRPGGMRAALGMKIK